jgi:hypothetical protein
MTEPRHRGSPPAPLPDDDLELLAMAPHDHGLENAGTLQGLRKIS